ncbi:MAG: hypothetical protein ACI4TF_12190 [Oliverpabstia sp.]
MKNWWYYHKWYVICGILLCLISLQLIGNAFGWFKKEPDLQIAYAGETPLPEDTVSAIEKAFSAFAGDYNQDGAITIQVNQYVSGSSEDASADASGYRQAAEIGLIADINDCESYFFLMDNPEELQKQYQILAMPDGTCPDSADISTDNKAILWSSFKALSGLDLGEYTTTLLGQETAGSNQEILSTLYLGRRCFYDERETAHAKECAALWNALKGDSNGQIHIGRNIRIDEPENLTLLDNKDALAADGLYYATWVCGNSSPYENSDGENVELYDAQLYFLTSETPNKDTAEKDCATWLSTAKETYDIYSEKTITCNDQTYTLIEYNCINDTNPYDHGISVFGTFDVNAVCIEFTCLENYDMELEPILTEFLNGCHYETN